MDIVIAPSTEAVALRLERLSIAYRSRCSGGALHLSPVLEKVHMAPAFRFAIRASGWW